MAAVDLGRRAGGSQQDIRLDHGRQTLKRGRIGRRLRRGEHVGTRRAGLNGRSALEILPGCIGKVRRKPKLREPRQTLAQAVDRIIGSRPRTVAALVGHFRLERHRHLLAGLDTDIEPATAFHARFATVRIYHKIGIHEVPVFGQQPVDAVAFAARLLVCGEGDDDVSLRNEMLALHAQQRREHGRVLSFHVYRAAPVQPPVVLGQVKRIARPVFRIRRDNVEMAQIQNRFAFSAAVEAGNDVAGARVVHWYEQLRVRRGKACCEQPRLYLSRHLGRADVVRRASVDQFTKNLAR